MLLTGQAQKLQSQSRNIIPHKDYQLPKEKKQIYTSDDEIHMSKRTKLWDPLVKESKFDVKPLNALFSEKSFSTVENVATAKVQ